MALGFISLPGLMNSHHRAAWCGVGNVSAYLGRRSCVIGAFSAWFHRCWLLVPLDRFPLCMYY